MCFAVGLHCVYFCLAIFIILSPCAISLPTVFFQEQESTEHMKPLSATSPSPGSLFYSSGRKSERVNEGTLLKESKTQQDHIFCLSLSDRYNHATLPGIYSMLVAALHLYTRSVISNKNISLKIRIFFTKCFHTI